MSSQHLSDPDTVLGSDHQPGVRARVRNWAIDFLAPLAAALALTLALMWPLPLFFTRATVGVGDVYWGLGTLWYWQQVFLGQEPWYYATRLYYPQGITFVTNAAGPFSALLGLPFWGLGPAAAYNGAIVLGFALTGFCMYVLARDLGVSRPAAYLGGLLYMMAPLHVYAALSHVNKVFLGFIPLALLVTNRALHREQWRRWALLAGPLLVLAFLQAPEQLVFAGLGCAALALYALLTAPPGTSADKLRRGGVVALSIVVCTLPLFLLMLSAGGSSGVNADAAAESALFRPDLLQFVTPAEPGILPHGPILRQLLTPDASRLVETAVYLSWAGLLLCGLAWWKNRRAAGPWLFVLGLAMLLALGPTLRAFGDASWLTRLEIQLPYALLNSLPGLNAMRTPGRFMLLGAAAFAAAAALGVDQLRRLVKPPLAAVLVALLAVYILLDTWLTDLPRQPLPPTLPFYQEIAQDPARYGVFDLPIRASALDDFSAWHILFSSLFQVQQITHGKGIATGYVSRHYATHPLFAHFISQNFDTVSPLQHDLTVDGQPSSRYANLRYYLAQHNYRYVVFHKPSAARPDYQPGSWGEQQAQALIQEVFGSEPPLVDDALSTVYAVGPGPAVATLQPSIALLEPAGEMAWGDFRSPPSPAAFLVHSPQPLLTHLDVWLEEAPGTPDYLQLTLQSGDGNVVVTTPAALHEPARVPVVLGPGSQTITMTVGTPEGYALRNDRLPIAIGRIDLSSQPDTAAQLPVDAPGLQAAFGGGWYAAEVAADGLRDWRWAASPAQVWVYSSAAQTVTLDFTPLALHDPAAPDGKGMLGSMVLAVNGAGAGEWPVTVGAPLAVSLPLDAGWNQVTLALAAGNFRPIDLQPESGDARSLSFALGNVAIRR